MGCVLLGRKPYTWKAKSFAQQDAGQHTSGEKEKLEHDKTELQSFEEAKRQQSVSKEAEIQRRPQRKPFMSFLKGLYRNILQKRI